MTLLALTSNKGAFDFQFIEDSKDGKKLFKKVLETSKQWGGTPDNMMYVVGATKAEMLSEIRAIIPDNFLLVPGVGAQGGSLEEVCKYGSWRVAFSGSDRLPQPKYFSALVTPRGVMVAVLPFSSTR